jgi:hypothetical protein
MLISLRAIDVVAANPARKRRQHCRLQTFDSQGDRRRLSSAAVKSVYRLVEAWGGSSAEGAALLGVSV